MCINDRVQASGYRQIPDVAFDANSSGGGVAVYSYLGVASGTPWTSVGGTSIGAPCWAGLVAIADQLRATEGLSPLRSAQTLSRLYQLPSSDFHDITTGSNGEYSAGTGYDMVTGLGSPIANSLVPDLVTSSGADLYVTVTDSGNFTQCDIGETYTITVSNIGDSPTSGEIDLANVLPSGLTATGFTCSDPNSDWTINSGTLTATCNDSLAAGASFPALTLTVNVASDAPATVTDTATVSGGGEVNTANDVGADLTTIIPGGPVCTWTGGGTDNNWTTAANWDIAPTAGSRLVFAGTTRQSPVNDFPTGTTFDSIKFTTSGFTLSGNAVTLSAPGGVAIDDADSENAVDLPITLGADGQFAVTGAGALYLTPNATVSLGGHDLAVSCSIDSTASQWAAPITGAGDFVMYGGGTLTLTNSSTYSGDTSIEDGTLVLRGGINADNRLPVTTNLYLGAGALHGVVQLGDSYYGRSNQTVAGLYGADNHSTVVGGYDAQDPVHDSSTLTVVMAADSEDNYNGSFGGTVGVESKLAVVVQSAPGPLADFKLHGDGNYNGGTTLSAARFETNFPSSLGTGPVTLNNGQLWIMGGPATMTNDVVADANTVNGIVALVPSGLTIAGNLSGSGEIDPTGGKFTLSGDNSGFTGTFYEAGVITTYLTSSSAGSAGATWWIDGGTFAADLSSNPTNQPIELGALKGTWPRFYGTVTNVGIPVTFEVGGNGQSTQFRGVIADGSGSSTVALTKVGTGILTLTGANTYSGDTTVENGTLALAGGNNRLPVGTAVVLGDNGGDSGVLRLGNGTTARNQTLAGLYAEGGSNNRVVGGGSGIATLTLTVAGSGHFGDAYHGFLGGPGTNENNLALAMTGPGTLELYAENTYTGGTYLDSGTIEEWIADETVLGDPSSPIYLAGGTLEAYGTFANPVVAQAGTTSYLATAAHLHGGGMALTGAISGSGTIDCSNAPFLAGELDLSGDNSQFSGTFRIHGSTSVYFNQQSAGSDQATWDIENSAHLVANLSSNPTGRPIKLGGLSGTGAYGVLTNAGIPVTFEVGATGQSTEFDGAITNGSGSSTVALTKVGAGRLTLGGADTYTGVTTIEGGTIVFKNPTAINNVLSNAGGVNDTGGFLVFDYTGGTDPAATVLARLTAAYNGGVNSFQTGQIRDSSATTQIGLGWLDNTTTHQVIVMPAVYGDADLNGVVNSADQGTTGTTWSQGDFNYDGTVNAADQAILTANYGQTGPLNINNMP